MPLMTRVKSRSFLTLVAVLASLGIIFQPMLANDASALRIDSLSSISGDIAGGEHLIIKGEDFIKDEPDKIIQVDTGSYHTLALTESGKVYTWGRNNTGQLGTGDNVDYRTPQDITARLNGETIAEVVAGAFSSYALTESGKLFAWGWNQNGQLGNGDNLDYNTPQSITYQFNNEPIVQLVSRSAHVLALTESGRVYSWGDNFYGELGNGTNNWWNTPLEITRRFGSDTIKFLASSGTDSAAITSSGEVYTWGRNNYGQLGLGDETARKIPEKVAGLLSGEVVVKVVNGSQHAFAFTSSGKIFAWGHNNFGQLGIGNAQTMYTTPQDVTAEFNQAGLGSDIELEAGYQHSLALTKSNRVYSFGFSYYGQLGTGDNINSYSSPQEITHQFGATKVVQLSGGVWHSVALTDRGEAYAFGHNGYGQLGTGDTNNRNVPQDITANFNLDSKPVNQIDSIYFGDIEVTDFEVIDANTIELTVPAHTAGKVNVTINDIHGGVTTLANGYEYLASGGETITPKPDSTNELLVPNTGA